MHFKNLVLLLLVNTCISAPTPDDLTDNATFFVRLGTYQVNKNTTKSYYIPRHLTSSWTQHRAVCQSYGMDSLSLETKDEETSFFELARLYATHFDNTYVSAGAGTLVGKTLDQWYWASSGKRIELPMKWATNQPDNAGGNQYCLVLHPTLGFDDLACTAAERKFICQK